MKRVKGSETETFMYDKEKGKTGREMRVIEIEKGIER